MKNLELTSLGLEELSFPNNLNIEGGVVFSPSKTVTGIVCKCAGAIHEIGDFFEGITAGLKEASKHR